MTRNLKLFFAFLISICLWGCKKDDSGTLVFKGVNEFPAEISLKSLISPTPSYIDSKRMHTSNLKTSIAEIWVSKDEITEGKGDNLEWHKIGESTGMKFHDEYEFVANNLPEGTYASIKIDFRNYITRYAVYSDNVAQTVEMSGSLNEENCGSDDVITNYFCSSGSYMLQLYPEGTTVYPLDTFLFKRMAREERVRGFTIHAGQTTSIYWKLGGPGMQLTDCWFYWYDYNNNNQWDCGTDSLKNFECNDNNMPMWSFVVDDGEIVPEDTSEVVIEEPSFVIDTNYSVTDVIGNQYKAVKIGNQIWMAENLKTPKLNDNTQIINVSDDGSWKHYSDNKLPAQCVYNNDIDYLREYGRFYNWYTIETGKLCPAGWHVPSKDEWQTLLDYLGNNAGPMLRINSGNYWNTVATNESYFSALPAGARNFQGFFFGIPVSAYWWTSTSQNGQEPLAGEFAYQLNLPGETTGYNPFDNGGVMEKGSGLSVRCIKD